jgi:hypothetical protein
MARLFTTGFELGEIIEHNGSMVYGTHITINSSVKRTGNYSCKFTTPGAIDAVAFTHTIPTKQELYARVAIYITNSIGSSANPQNFLAFFYGNTCHIAIGFPPSTFLLQVRRGGSGEMGHSGGTVLANGNIPLTMDNWWVVEVYVKISASAGQVIAKVNGVVDISFSGNTSAGGTEGINVIKFGLSRAGPNVGCNLLMDDIAVNDTSGTYQNSWVGQGGVYLLRPNGDGAVTQWTRSGGTTNYENVDEVPKNTTDWVQGQTSGTKDLYTLADLPVDVKIVDMVETVWQAALSQAGWNSIKGVIRPGTTDYVDVDEREVTSVHPNYVLYKGDIYYVNPGTGLAWQPSEVNGMQAGILIP